MKRTTKQFDNGWMKVVGILVSFFAIMMLGCEKHPTKAEQYELKMTRMSAYPCVCKESHIAYIVTNEVIATEDIGKRYEVQTHHYYPTVKDSEGRKHRWEVAVGYPKQYLREGEPTDTSISSNKTCWCGGLWEFTTNGYFSCKRITSRTGMNCAECGGAKWKTNVTIYAEKKDVAK